MKKGYLFRIAHLSIWIVSAGLCFSTLRSQAQPTPGKGHNQSEIVLKKGLAVRAGRLTRSPLYTDPITAALARNAFVAPTDGSGLTGPADTTRWKAIDAGADGYFDLWSIRSSVLYIPVNVKKETTMILEASGQDMVYVNGVPRAGDVYDYGWIRHPVRLKKGLNEFIFRVSRGKVRARLVQPAGDQSLTTVDMTLPDLIIGESETAWGAVRIINAVDKGVKNLKLRCTLDGSAPLEVDVPIIGPLTTRKVGFKIPSVAGINTETVRKGTIELFMVSRKGSRLIDTDSFDVTFKKPDQRHNRTFVSEIDGSVQYYGVVPGGNDEGKKPAMFLSLHGASVEAVNQARAFKSKSWGYVVTPTNRRPYGFDWEDWGRLDAMEVLAEASRRFDTDPIRTYLTGHSMGGHGTWIIGATYPDRFAAIAPICGWYSFWSYGMRSPEQPTEMQKQMLRAANASQTLGLKRNYVNQGIYIVHGQLDDNVPVEQARFMKKMLAEFHPDFAYKEVPLAGHWWSDESADYPPVYDYFRWHRLKTPVEVDTVRFTTASPGVSEKAFWATISAQLKPMEFSTITIVQDTAKSIFSGKTENVARLGLETRQLPHDGPVSIELDGQKLATPAGWKAGEPIWLVNDGSAWSLSAAPTAMEKNPKRAGTFKDAFRHHMVFVYGTKGTREENEWAYNKARYDAEAFWYRGNGSVDVVADVDFKPEAEPDRGVILFGNSDSNLAWHALLGDSPIQVKRGRITMGDRVYTGNDLGAYFVRPRTGSEIASVGVVTGTGLAAMKAAYPNPYFLAGTGYPDVFVFRTSVLEKGEEGIVLWGYFGNDWSVERGDWFAPGAVSVTKNQ